MKVQAVNQSQGCARCRHHCSRAITRPVGSCSQPHPLIMLKVPLPTQGIGRRAQGAG